MWLRSVANVGAWCTLTSLATMAGASPSSSANFAASARRGKLAMQSHHGCALASGTSTSVITPFVPYACTTVNTSRPVSSRTL